VKKLGEEKTSRRDFVKYAATGVVGAAIGAGAGYAAWGGKEKAAQPSPTSTVPTDVTEAITVDYYKTVEQRAIDSAKQVMKRDNIPAGTTLTVMIYGTNAGAIERTKERWESETGLKVEINPTGWDIYDKLMLEATAKSGANDIFLAEPWMTGDIASSGLLLPLDAWIQKYDPRMKGKPDGFMYNMDLQCMWDGKTYLMPDDGDQWLMLWRDDIGEDPKEQEDFEKQYGMPLKFPTERSEYEKQCKFFTRAPDLYGSAEGRGEGAWSWGHYMWRYAETKWPFNHLFDDNMNPTIDSPEGIEIAEEYGRWVDYVHPENLVWGIPEIYGSWTEGNAQSTIIFASCTKFTNMEPSKIIGKVAYGMPPGTLVDTPQGKRLNAWTINGAGSGLGVNAYGKYPELAYLYIQYLLGPENIVLSSADAGDWWDPIRYNQAGPLYDRRMKHDPKALAAIPEAVEKCIPMLGLKGAGEYNLKLNRNLHRICLGELSAEEFVKEMSTEWNDTTDTQGRQAQIADWKEFKKLYPLP
jgi:multiple sugar transport system substrate-binding protein